ncbi:MAG: MinD/ParA family protein [Ignavibacteriales bacterium]|nr:MinD/ParA family protein [Ignavibacteriales bacterium]
MAVACGKGGVGKSTVALNMSVALGAIGKRVLLVDADANLANLDIMAGVAPQYRLGHVLRRERDIEDVLVSVSPNLFLLPGSSADTAYPEMGNTMQQRLMDGIRQLEARFDYAVIDTGAGLSPSVIRYATESDETFVVTSTEPTSVMDAYATIKLVTAAKPVQKMAVIVNGAHSPSEADEAMLKLQMAVRHFLHRDVEYLCSIPFDKNVQRAVVAHQPVSTLYPTSASSLSFRQAVQRILVQEGQEERG